MILHNFLIWCLIYILFFATETACKKGELGERCGPNLPCDPDFSLVCIGTCQCPTGSYRDVASQSCYARANSTCELPTESDPHPLRCTPDSNCVPNGTEKVCICNEGFQRNNDGKCVVGEYGQLCDPHRDKCDTSQHLVCSNDNRCRCSSSSVYLNEKCHRLRGASCALFSEPCIPRSTCEGPTGNKTCICYGGTDDTNSRYSPMCDLPFGAPCLWPDLCDTSKFLQCLKFPTVCSCNVTLNDTYEDLNSGNCYLLHGRNCSTEEGSKRCHLNSECTLVDKDNDIRQCLCKEGFSPNEEELCFLPFGGSCDQNNDLCDSDSHLACSEAGICECKDPSMWFDQIAGICRILVGNSCKRFGANRPICVDNALCLNGVCKCRNDYTYKFEIGPDRQCYLPFGAGCTPGNATRDHCSPYQRLNCNITTIRCDCNDKKNSVFNDETGSCLSLVGAKCTQSEHCFPNSYCKKPYGASEGICSCNSGLSLNKERKCFLTNHGDKCNADLDLCDPSSFLYCHKYRSDITNMTISQCSCSIREKMYYEKESGECRLKAGSPCNPSIAKSNKDPKCGARMTCDPDDYNCRCDSPYEKNEEGKCLLSRGQNCQGQNTICDSTKFLICDKGVCDCGKDALFDTQLDQCVIQLGGHCSLDYHSNQLQQCVQNTTCESPSYRCSCEEGYDVIKSTTIATTLHSYCLKSFGSFCYSDDECNSENHLVCIDKKCRCSGDYLEYDTEISTPHHQDASGHSWRMMCLPTYNISCSDQLPCHPSLSLQCANNEYGKSCSCLNSYDYVYHHMRKRCVGLVGSSCEVDEACVEGGYCAQRNGTTLGVCSCLSMDYLENRMCEVGITMLSSAASYKNVFSAKLFVIAVYWTLID